MNSEKKMWNLVLFLILSITTGRTDSSTALEYLKRADDIRNPALQYQMLINVKTPQSESSMKVYLNGPTQTLIVTVKPTQDIGRNMLMLDRDFYTYVPSLKRSVRLSLSQKLSGQIANGDVARTRWNGDYKILSTKLSKTTIELFLEGTQENLTYQKIRLWLEASTARPKKAEYLSTNGTKILKTAYFSNYKKMLGLERPTLITIKDPTGKTSTINIQSMEIINIKKDFFTESNMERMR
jgi:outer membrane lipoprotein-sorting protein